MSKLQALFNPKSIAIVGASSEEGKIGNILAKNILELGYGGKVFLVNPKYDTLFDQTCFHSLSDIPEEVDLAVIALPAKIVFSVIESVADKIKNFMVISAGFSETNEEGKEREQQLKKLAEEKNLNIIGPNCLGFIMPNIKLNASFASGMPEAGNISFVSQSGALAVAIMDIARKENIKFSNIVSVGNKMQVDESAMLEYLATDEKTKVIGMYLEGIKNGERFLEVATRVSKIKPIVILKAGKTAQAQKAIASHTGALAGSDEIMGAAFEKAGILRADNLEEFFALIEIMSYMDAPENNKAIVLTNAGGPGVLATDSFSGKHLELQAIDDETKNKLREFLPFEASVSNPIDLLGDAKDDRYAKALDILENLEADTIICILTPQDQTPVALVADKILEHKNKSTKKIVPVFIGGERVDGEIARLKENGVLNFAYPDEAINVLDAYCRWNERQKIKKSEGELIVDENRQTKMMQIIQKAKDENREALLFAEAQEMMQLYGINTPRTITIDEHDQLPAFVDFPVAMKVDSDKVLHKTDKQGLILNIKNRRDLERAHETLKMHFPKAKYIIQQMLETQNELILGIKNDSVFGPVIIFGLGGIYTEVFKTVNFLMQPDNKDEIYHTILKSKIAFLFKETRGQAPCDAYELADVLWKLAQLAHEGKSIIRGLDINPLFIYNNGKEAMAADVKVII